MKSFFVTTQQTEKIGPVRALRVYLPSIAPYMGIHWADFYSFVGKYQISKVRGGVSALINRSTEFVNKAFDRSMAAVPYDTATEY